MLVRLLASYLYVAADQELTFRVRWLCANPECARMTWFWFNEV